ncbi:MAG: Ig-like domain-containing protein, partial [Gammaproteobacteria bacterium]|nr:Ig-like domain-containing protein [Gammaproteobacteria bacterium]
PYQWRSSQTGVATIDATSGLLTAKSPGATTITVTDSTGLTANASVSVVSSGGGGTSPNLTLLPSGLKIVKVGATLQFSVTGGTAPYTWGTANSALGSVDATGLFLGIAPGITTVNVRDANGNTAVSANIIVSLQ